MKKSTIKGIIAGVVAGAVIVGTSTVFAEDIQVLLNSVNINLNGQKVASVDESYELQNGSEVPYSILYEGTTYLPIRKVSELLEIGIGWDNDTRTVLIDSESNDPEGPEVVVNAPYDSWYGAPDFGEFYEIEQLAEYATVHSTSHWYNVEDVASSDEYIEKLKELGYEKITEGGIKPKFKVYKKGDIEVWLDLGLYTKMVFGVTVVDTTRPVVSRDFDYLGANEDIPFFGSAFGFSTKYENGNYYTLGEWDMWSCIPDYLSLLEDEGFTVTGTNKSYYGKSLTIKKGRSTLYMKFDGTEYSNIPALSMGY